MIQWIEISGDDIAGLESFAREHGVHPLALEDCIHRDQRPKLEDYSTHQFLVWFMVARGRIYELQFIIFPNRVVFVPHDVPPDGGSWGEYFRVHAQTRDAWHMLYHTLDRATDVTSNDIRALASQIDDFEQRIFKGDCEPLTLLELKKQMNHLDYSLAHLPSVAIQLQDFYKTKDDLVWKWRDLHDHCERNFRNLSLNRSQIGSTIDLYWGHQADKSNRHIKKLSMLASVSVPLTFWTSFWGMNFTSLPFDRPAYLYFAIGIMGLSSLGAVLLLIKRGYWTD